MRLPTRYILLVEVKLVELPNQFEPPEEPFQFSTDDPMKQAAELMQRAIKPPAIISGLSAIPYQQPSGFDFRKSASVTVQSFAELAEIVGPQFEALTKQIESERP